MDTPSDLPASASSPPSALPKITPRYRPSIERLKQEYSSMLARRRMLRLHHERHPNLQPSRITDNSEPWFTEWPPSLATLLQTNCEIWKLEAYLNNRASTGSAPL